MSSDEEPTAPRSDVPDHLPSGDWGAPSGEFAQAHRADRYREQSLLGEGGMGRVVVASDTVLRRSVAVKKALGTPNGPEAERLLREARITASLDHPGIVAVHDLGEDDEGRPFYVMRHVRGRHLGELIHEATSYEERLHLLRSFLTACEAVGFAHQAGVIHRDLKPENILIGPLGETQVMDWGLARPLHDSDWGGVVSQDFRTRTGAVLGTPAYMSPEQASGEETGPPVDVWALGALLHELLSGERAFKGPSQREMIAQILSGSRSALSVVVPDIDPGLAAIVERALQRDPADRYPDAAAMAADVEAWLDGRAGAQATGGGRVGWLLAASVAAAALVVGWGLGQRTAEGPETVIVQDALVLQAQSASAEGRRMEAEQIAADALRLGEHPGARGVIAYHRLEETPTLLSAADIGECRKAVLDAGSDLLACTDGESLRTFDTAGELLWSAPVGAEMLRFGHGASHLAVRNSGRNNWMSLNPRTGDGLPLPADYVGERTLRMPRAGLSQVPGRLLSLQNGRAPLVELDDYFASGNSVEFPACADRGGAEWALEKAKGEFFIACADRSIVRKEGVDGEEILFLPAKDQDSIVWTGALHKDGRWLALGGVEGDLELVDMQERRRVFSIELAPRMVRDVAISPDGSMIGARDSTGDAWVIPTQAPELRYRIPGDVRHIGFDATSTIIVRARSIERWSTPLPAVHTQRPLQSGLNDVRWGEAGLVASAKELVWTDMNGHLIRRVSLQGLKGGVPPVPGDQTRGVDWLPDGSPSVAGYGIGHIKVTRDSIEQIDTGTIDVFALASGHMLAFSKDKLNPVLWTPERSEVPNSWVPGWSPMGGSQSPNRRFAILGGRLGRVVLATDGSPPKITPLAPDPEADGSFVTNDGETHYLIKSTGLVRRPVLGTPEDDELVFPARRLGPTELTRDERYFLAGYSDGRIEVRGREDGQLVATIQAHDRRVSGISPSWDGTRFASGSWDRTLRLVDLTAVDVPRAKLIEEVDQRWSAIAAMLAPSPE